jgi:hypothetical protein
MITLKKVLSSNLSTLESQEAELEKTLQLVRKAKKVFKSRAARASGPARKTRGRGRPAKATRQGRNSRAVTRRKRKIQPGSHLASIIGILKSNKGTATSGQVIQTMFKKQRKDKDFKHYRQLIYPVLTRAYKSGTLVLKNGKIRIPS